MYSEILEITQTTDDLEILKGELAALKNSLFKTTEGSFDEVLKSDVRKSIKERIEKSLSASKADKKTFLEGLEKELESVKTLKLTLALEPDGKSFSDIYAWIVKNVGLGVVLDIFYSPGIIGGAIVSYEGKYHDGSLLKKIEQTGVKL